MRTEPIPSTPSSGDRYAGGAGRRGFVTRALAFWCFASIGVALPSACSPHYQHMIERPLPATGALVCPGYLAWNNEPVRDVFLVINGSGALSNAFVHPTLEGPLHTYRVAYATYDKPGIQATPRRYDETTPHWNATRSGTASPARPLRCAGRASNSVLRCDCTFAGIRKER